ncbi:MAG: N-formylglutamate amidohydrolase [Kordiimonadaceae bacterium]|nr:N-formylglutamate amidohydrolase [Kordiimonadaceae bacterium]
MVHQLLKADDPAPFVSLRPNGPSQFVFVSEHAGNDIPSDLGSLGLSSADINDHIGLDLHICQVGKILSEAFDAPYIYQPYSRLVIDCNRPPASPQSILSIADKRDVPGNLNLSDKELAERRFEIFEPFHKHITEILDHRSSKNMPTVFVTLHSFTPAMQKENGDRPWHVTLQYSRDDRFSKAMITALGSQTTSTIGDNVPYPVNDDTHYGIPVHGEKRGLHHTMIEIRQDVITNATDQKIWAKILKTALISAAKQLDT